MQTLTKADLNFVLTKCPQDIRRTLKENAGKLFLAGGFIRATIAGEEVSDIDLLGTPKEDLVRIGKDLTLSRKGRYFETKNALTVLSHPRFPVQFVTRWLYKNPEDVINSFDYTVCQATIWAEDITTDLTQEEITEGKKIKKEYKFHSLVSDNFYSDLAAKRLVYCAPKRDEEAGGSLLRTIKFIKKGYNIQPHALAGVIARVAMKVDWNKIGYDENRAAQVITGLLREVDPLTVVDGVDFIDEHQLEE